MATETVHRCKMCDKHDMVPTSINKDKGYFDMCPNCDDPRGIMPKPKKED